MKNWTLPNERSVLISWFCGGRWLPEPHSVLGCGGEGEIGSGIGCGIGCDDVMIWRGSVMWGWDWDRI